MLTNAYTPPPPLTGNCTLMQWTFLKSLTFHLRFSPLLLSERFFYIFGQKAFFVQLQPNEDLKYEDKKQAISCDLVQVWASHWEEGLLQNMSEALQEILRPLLIQIHTLPLCGTMPSFRHWYRLSRNNTTLRAQDVLWGGIGRDFTVAPARRPPGYFDTLPTLPSFRLHF